MTKPLVLILDDERYFLLLVKEMVEEAGYAAIVSNDVEEGVRLFYEKKPALVLMDIVMPKEFGTVVCRDLKETDQGKDTPIILMSSGVKEMAEEDGLIEYKADEYLLKPFDKNVFFGLLKKHLDKDNSKTVSFREREPEKTKKEKFPDDLFDIKDIKPYDGRKRGTDSKVNVGTLQLDKFVQISQEQGGIAIRVKVCEETRNVFLGNSMMNLKTGGVFVSSDQPAPLGSKIDFQFEFAEEELAIKGMVVWMQPANITTGQKAGMGIRFHDQKSEGLARLKEFVFSLR